jgi:hypothetical protein
MDNSDALVPRGEPSGPSQRIFLWATNGARLGLGKEA